MVRFFLAVLFTVTMFYAPLARAQDAGQAPDYKNASDAQIKEAQAFFKYCEKDKVMSLNKDCKCAATAYLDARIALGEKAPRKDVARAIRDKCYKSTPANPAVEQGISGPNDGYFKDVTDKQLEEAEEVYLECTNDLTLRTAFDCECRSASFLELRLQEGPIAQRSNLLFQLGNKCRNVVESVGREYSNCIKDVRNDTFDIDRKTFCECYSRKWGELYENMPGHMTFNAQVELSVQSRGYCIRNAGKQQPAPSAAQQ